MDVLRLSRDLIKQ
ncbi:hypothetical protein ZOSMA_27G00330, partial [Zostera marina]